MNIQDVAYESLVLPDYAKREDFAVSVQRAIDQYLDEADYEEDLEERNSLLDYETVNVWVAPFQAENLNTEGGHGFQFLYEYPDFVPAEDNSVRVALEWLCESQGYVFEDLLDEEKCKQSTFLGSLSDEIEQIHATTCALVFYGSMTCADLLALSQEGAKLYAPQYIKVGLFDPTAGGGSLLNVQLETGEVEVPISWGGYFPEIQYSGEKRSTYGYSVQDVYGFWRELVPFEVRA